MTGDSTDDTEKIDLGPFTTAKRVNGSVLIREQRGNLVKKVFIDEDEWESIGSLFNRSSSTDIDQ